MTLTTLSDSFQLFLLYWKMKPKQNLGAKQMLLWLKLSWVNYKIIINISESVPRNYASISITSVYKQNQFSLNMIILPRLIIKAFPMPDQALCLIFQIIPNNFSLFVLIIFNMAKSNCVENRCICVAKGTKITV